MSEVNTHPCVAPPAPRPLSRWYNRAVKRLADIVISAILLLTLFPLIYVVVAVVAKAVSRGPVMVREPRRVFEIRTCMFVEKNMLRFRLPGNAFVRLTRIDRWPRLIDVLFGRTTLAAPRPNPADINHYLRHWSPLLDVGLAIIK